MPERVIPCPFCDKDTVKERFVPGMMKVTHLSDKSSRSKEWQPEQSTIISGCEECNRTKQEVIKRYKEGKEFNHEKKMKSWKESGLPTSIGGD